MAALQVKGERLALLQDLVPWELKRSSPERGRPFTENVDKHAQVQQKNGGGGQATGLLEQTT